MKDPTDHALLSADLIADTLALTHSLRNDEAGRKGTDRNGRGSPSGSSAGRERSIERNRFDSFFSSLLVATLLMSLTKDFFCRCTTSVLAHNHARADRNPTASSKGDTTFPVKSLFILGVLGVFGENCFDISKRRAGL